MINRTFYILSQVLDFFFVFLFVWTINESVNSEIIKIGNTDVVYSATLALSLYVIFILIYFIIYPIFNDKMSLFENVFSLSLVDNSISFIKVLFTNMVFWIAILELIISLVDIPNTDFHSNFILIFIAFMYLVFMFLEIDLVSLFGTNIKFMRE